MTPFPTKEHVLGRDVDGRLAFVGPFFNDTNPYLELQKELLSQIGFVPQPFSLKKIWRLGGIFSSRNLICLHWLEARPFVTRGGSKRPSLRGTLEWLAYMGLLLVARARIVYWIHNHAPHDVHGRWRRFGVWCMRAASARADIRVVHDRASAGRYDAVYLPHPLYSKQVANTERTMREAGRELRYSVLGAMRPYKGLRGLLSVWPQGSKLVLAGSCKDEDKAELEGIVSQRGLQADVTLRPGFLSRDAFLQELRQSDVLVLPHSPDTALVSGLFFEAIGRVPVILARRSSFIDWAAGEFPNLVPYDRDEDLPAAIARAEALRRTAAGDRVAHAAEEHFGWAACIKSYRAALAA